MNHNKNNDLYIHNNYDWLLGGEKVKSQQSGFNDWDDNSWNIEEYRVDPFDLKLYNHKEFLDYYGRYLEWDFQDPRLIIHRKNINNMIMGYRNILPPENINFLLNKIIDTFM